MEWTFGWSLDPETLEEAWKWGQATLDLDSSIPEAHSVLGEILLWKGEHQLAIQELQMAVSIAPNEANFLAGLGSIKIWAGAIEEGAALTTKAMRLNPVYPAYYVWQLGHSFYLSGRLDEAVEAFEKATSLNPDWFPSHVFSAICFAEMGRMEEAQASLRKVLEAQPTFSVEHWEGNIPYKNQGDTGRWADGLRAAGMK